MAPRADRLIARSTSSPLIPGMQRSLRTSSGACAVANASDSSPLEATSTVCPARSSINETTVRTLGSSSTSKMRAIARCLAGLVPLRRRTTTDLTWRYSRHRKNRNQLASDGSVQVSGRLGTLEQSRKGRRQAIPFAFRVLPALLAPVRCSGRQGGCSSRFRQVLPIWNSEAGVALLKPTLILGESCDATHSKLRCASGNVREIFSPIPCLLWKVRVPDEEGCTCRTWRSEIIGANCKKLGARLHIRNSTLRVMDVQAPRK